MRVRALFAAALAASALIAAGATGTANAAGDAAPSGTGAAASFTVWATDVNMRDSPGDPARCDSLPSVGNCPVVAGRLQPGDHFEAACQKQGEPVGGNPWWVYASYGDSRGFVASHYVDVAEDQLPGVPVCGA